MDYRDADRIVTLFTDTFGKVDAIARQARKSRRRFGGALEPGALLSVEVTAGRGELWTLRSAQILRAYPPILGDLRRIRALGRALEHLRRTTGAGIVEPDLFEDLGTLHEQVAERAPEDAFAVALAFSLRALALLGHAPELEHCVVSGAPCPPGRAAELDPSRGGIVRREAGGGPILLTGALRAALAETLRPTWSDARFPEGSLDVVERVVDDLAAPLVGRRV